MKPVRIVLRNCDCEHLKNVTDPDEATALDYRAMMGECIKTQVPKRGRLTLIYTLKDRPIPTADPSKSPDSACVLTEGDMNTVIGAFDKGVMKASRRQIERILGHLQAPRCVLTPRLVAA